MVHSELKSTNQARLPEILSLVLERAEALLHEPPRTKWPKRVLDALRQQLKTTLADLREHRTDAEITLYLARVIACYVVLDDALALPCAQG